jgi:tripartite-type tricarboxylate transporter receptor subunit TctC
MRIQRRELFRLGVGGAAIMAAPHLGRAQTYPSSPIRLVIPFPPGGVFDVVGRPWAYKVRTDLGTVYIENLAGAGGAIGAQNVSRATPDGYTILLGASAINLYELLLRTKPLFDPTKDIVPISMIAITCFGIGVHPSVPVKSLSELVALIKANPGKMAYGSSSPGSMNHLTGEMFKFLTGITDLPIVPYKGAGPALIDAAAGNVLIIIPAMTSQVVQLHRSGKLRMLAVTHTERLAGAPEIPTANESGVPGLVTQQVLGIFGPAGISDEIFATIEKANRAALSDDAYRQSLIDAAVIPISDPSPEKFNQFMEEDIKRWSPLVKKIGVKI